jgi:hypothetical protein
LTDRDRRNLSPIPGKEVSVCLICHSLGIKICPTKAISLEEEGDGKKDFSDGVNGALLW